MVQPQPATLYDSQQTTGGDTVKKAWLVVALTALSGLAASTFADVQNIRLSGDIRLRGYYLADSAEAEDTGGSPQALQDESFFISQRTRVCVEADLEDHVLVVVTLKAEGLWGASDNTTGSSGAGTEDEADGKINRLWDLGITEAYVQLNELFYSPATAKIGRQYLNYGRGLIISSAEQEYNFDAARLVLDLYPVTIDIVGARQQDFGSFGGDSPHPSSDLLFVNARGEVNANNAKVNLEGYFGWLAQSAHGGASSLVAPPSVNGASPMIIGGRTDIAVPGFTTWAEAAYEFGTSGSATPTAISALIANLGFRAGSKDAKLAPSINGGYTYASGGGRFGRHDFVPWFDYVDGYNGYLFAPRLSNLHIFNLGGSLKPADNLSLALQVYYYLKVDADTSVGSNLNVDFGGGELFSEASQTNAREIGWEIDTIAGYDYSKDVRMQLVYGMFIPQGCYQNSSDISSVAHEVRGEVSVKF